MSKFLLSAAAAALVAGGLSAQTKVISPAQFAKKPGNYFYHYYPIYTTSSTTYQVCRYQEVMDLPATAKGKLSALALRASAYHATYGAPPAFTVTMEIKASTAATNAGTMSTSWASNEGKDVTTVLAKKAIKFAVFPLLPKFPQPFFYKFPFDQNKVLAFAGGKSLCLDMTQFSNDLYRNSTYNYFYTDSVSFTYTSALATHKGRACYSSNPYFLPFYGYTYGYIYTSSNNYRHYGYSYYGPANGLAVQVVSAGEMPVGLPIAGGCSLYVDLSKVLWTMPATTDSRGYARYPKTGYFEFPWKQAYNGAELNAQSFAFDAKANSAGIVATQLNKLNLPSYMKTGYPVSSIYRTGYNSQTTGYARKGYGHVNELTFN